MSRPCGGKRPPPAPLPTASHTLPAHGQYNALRNHAVSQATRKVAMRVLDELRLAWRGESKVHGGNRQALMLLAAVES